MLNTDDIDYLTVEYLNSHPPFPLPAEKVDEFRQILVTVRHRIEIAGFSKESAAKLLFLKHENRCYHTNPSYSSVLNLAKKAENQSDFTVRRFKALEKRILQILKKNNMTPK